MRTAIFASWIVLLSACAGQPARPGKPPPAATPADVRSSACPVLPITENMWEVYRKDVLEARIESPYAEWLYPAYVGIASLSWAGGAPFFPVMDLMMAPARLMEPCLKMR